MYGANPLSAPPGGGARGGLNYRLSKSEFRAAARQLRAPVSYTTLEKLQAGGCFLPGARGRCR